MTLAFWAFMVCAAALGTFWLLTGSSEDVGSDESRLAVSYCEDAVSAELPNPTTAEFDSTATDGESWTISGSVDSKAETGAVFRASYECAVTLDLETDSAQVKLVRFER